MEQTKEENKTAVTFVTLCYKKFTCLAIKDELQDYISFYEILTLYRLKRKEALHLEIQELSITNTIAPTPL